MQIVSYIAVILGVKRSTFMNCGFDSNTFEPDHIERNLPQAYKTALRASDLKEMGAGALAMLG